jgi:hypothetical protein
MHLHSSGEHPCIYTGIATLHLLQGCAVQELFDAPHQQQSASNCFASTIFKLLVPTNDKVIAGDCEDAIIKYAG